MLSSIEFSTIDVPGQFCVSIYISGCSKHCKGCQNVKLWDFNYGEKYNHDYVEKYIEDSKLSNWICILGGEPLESPNIVRDILDIAKKQNKKVMLYTGFNDITEIPNDIIEHLNLKVIKLGEYIKDNTSDIEDLLASKNQYIMIHNDNNTLLFDEYEIPNKKRIIKLIKLL
jgi:anaerobic ribonucleoside-triphosphate reductase activating protein